MYVLVTTEFRGVFAGELVGEPTREKVTLRRARNCIYWRNGKGFLGLAQDGPVNDCKVGTLVEGDLTLYQITSIAECSEEARKQWEQA